MKALIKGTAFLMVVVMLGIGWLYREPLVGAVKRLVSTSAPVSAIGRPSAEAKSSATKKLRAFVLTDIDSIVLDPSETASLLYQGLEPLVRGNMDSLEVELLEGGIGLRALVRTGALARDLLGPLSALIEPWEAIAASGPLHLAERGRAEWRVEQLALRDIPFPPDMVPAVVSRIAVGTSGGAIPVPVPEQIERFTLTPAGFILYRQGRAP